MSQTQSFEAVWRSYLGWYWRHKAEERVNVNQAAKGCWTWNRGLCASREGLAAPGGHAAHTFLRAAFLRYFISNPAFQEENDFVRRLREEAKAMGLDPEAFRNSYTMRLDLT